MRPCSLDAHVLFSLVFFVLSIHLGEDRLESEPSSPKLLRSERPTRIERTARTASARKAQRGALLDVGVQSDGDLFLEGEEKAEQVQSTSALNGCGWGDWSTWSACSASCGEAKKQRSRGLETKEGGDVVYAVKNSELYRQSASLWSSGTAWEKVFLGESIALESIVISGDVIYAISVDRRLHQQNLKDLTPSAWLQIGSERNWTQVLPYRGTLYGISEKKILKRSFSNSSEDWTVWAWGEEWKQLAIGGSEEVAYGLSVEGKLFWQSFSSMSPNSSWKLFDERLFLQVAVAGGMVYGVGVDKRIYQAKSEGGWSLSSSSTSNDWIAVMLGGGMIYALSNDQKLSRQALQELRESDGTSWSTASEQGFGSVALQRPGYTYYTLANSVQSAGWCVDEMRFFDQTGGLLHPVASAGARSLRHPSFCANSSGSLRYEFEASTAVETYSLRGERAKQLDWVLEGSLDGSSWMKLDLQKEVNSEGEWMNFPILSQICDPSESTDEQTCERPPCPEDCGVSDWSDWSCAACASRATRNRSLLSEAQHGGRCGELEQRGHACDPSSCPVDCVYNTWSQWSNCPVTCSGGVRTRNRTVKDEMRYGGKPCDGSNFQKEACNAQKCPVDCAWDDWGDFGPCSDSCGGGQQLRRRGTRPAQWGGRACEGEEKETVACALMLCPVDCQWSDWQTWSDCSKPCGGGLKLRRRGIAVQGGYGGEVCAPDAAQEAIDCNVLNCSADCVWGTWSDWSSCGTSCGGGLQIRSRQQISEAIGEGSPCGGTPQEDRECNSFPCPQDCLLGDWSMWSPCSTTCGPGQRYKERTHLQEPVHGGAACAPATLAKEIEDCVTVTHCEAAVAGVANGTNRTSVAAAIMNVSGGVSPVNAKSKRPFSRTDEAAVAGAANGTNRTSGAAAIMNVSGGVSPVNAKSKRPFSRTDEVSQDVREVMETLDTKRPFSQAVDSQDFAVSNQTNAWQVNQTQLEMNLTELLLRAAEGGVSHCVIYQRQPEPSSLEPREVLELGPASFRSIDDCCERCSDFHPSGDTRKECSAIQFLQSPSGAEYCVLMSGLAYNESMVGSDRGTWLVRMPEFKWPLYYTTTTTTTTTTTMTSTSTTSTTSTITETTSVTNTSTTTIVTVTNTSTAPYGSSTKTVSTSKLTTSEDEHGFEEMGIPEAKSIEPPPLERAQWLVATKPETCDQTCQGIHERCDFAHLKATVDSQRQTQIAFAQAGFSCLSFGTGCSPEDCPSWGAPFLHQSFMDGSTLMRNGQGDPCFFGNDAAPCDAAPADRNHRRLCACSVTGTGAAASGNVVGYEVLEVSNVRTFLSSEAIKDSIIEAVALLADVPRVAVQVFLQYLKSDDATDPPPDQPGSVVMVHVINASATCKSPQVIREALEAEARAEIVDKVLKPLLAMEGPFEEVGPGSCLDVEGKEYDTFGHEGTVTLKSCKDACMLFTAQQCHGLTFAAGRCELRMEDGFDQASQDWSLSWAEGTGHGTIQANSPSGATSTRCWRRTDGAEPTEQPSNHTTEQPSGSVLSGIMDWLPDMGILSGLGSLFR